MTMLCEVCGTVEEREDWEMTSSLLHVCDSCIKDRAPYEHRTSVTDNAVFED
jgi:ribosome-binding protein aMBF1 (putative translation factor)